jgi:transcriptional regulator with XRE-family HTH domain
MNKKAPRPDLGSIAQKCAMLTKLNSFTQAELARRLGLRASNLNHFLRGHGDVRASLLLAILNELGISVEEMINAELARKSGFRLAERPKLGETFESIATALDRDDRQTLVRYVTRMAQVNLGQLAKPQVQALKVWAKQKN